LRQPHGWERARRGLYRDSAASARRRGAARASRSLLTVATAAIRGGMRVERGVVLAPDVALRTRGFPLHVRDLLARAEIVLGMAMAGEAPLHEERLCLVDLRHEIDAPVARDAADPLRDVDRVIE